MIEFREFVLDNGLTVIIHEDNSVPAVCLNLLYRVGSRNENPDRTGLAHLFEHLMFAGSKNVPNFDEPLQAVGGDNNAFTNTDITNYYTLVPAANIETAFWLESDRMKNLDINQKSLDIQKNVVIEEFNQRYLNQPYGDAWLKLRPMAYHSHPYQWATIGKSIQQIKETRLDEIHDFYSKFYAPTNAILVISGQVSYDRGLNLAKKWFEDIVKESPPVQKLPGESPQNEARKLKVTEKVPQKVMYKAYHMMGRMDHGYHAVDLTTDLLGTGKSSVLYQKLVRKSQLLSSVSCYITGSVDPGLLVFEGKLNESVSFEEVESEFDSIVDDLKSGEIFQNGALEKVKNMAESSVAFGNIDLLNRAMSLAYASFLGNTHLVNEEIPHIRAVTEDDITSHAKNIFNDINSNTLLYDIK